jgi:hypothetical protein
MVLIAHWMFVERPKHRPDRTEHQSGQSCAQ